MPYDSNGNFTLVDTYFVENGDTVLPIQHNPPLEDIQAALSAVLVRDGRAPMTGNLNMASKKIISLSDGTAPADAVNKGQLDIVTPKYLLKSLNYTAVAADANASIRFTSSATLSLTAAATLGSGWRIAVIADGGAVTIDPNGSETINGALTLVIPNGETTQIVCDGANFFLISKPAAWETIGDYSLTGVTSLDITNLSAFRKIRATGHLYPSATSAVNLVTSSNNGSSYDTGATDYNAQIMQAQGATLTGFSGNAAFIGISGGVGVSNTVDDGIQFEFVLDNFNKASRMKYISKSFFIGTAGNYANEIGAQRLQATARSALRIIAASGTLSGTVLVEGVRG